MCEHPRCWHGLSFPWPGWRSAAIAILPSSFDTALGDPSIDEASCLSPSVILALFKNYVCVHVCMSVCTCMEARKRH